MRNVPVIEIEGLRKHYVGFRGGTTAIDGLDLAVPEGGVFGFLGPNGAGKTTTIRCLMALARPTSGSVQILGVNPAKELSKVISRIGAIVETPTFFGRFSGERNLLLLGRLNGIGRQAVREAMDRVGLGGREKDLVRDYSLGMKQRLGLAAALLKDPELMILDEPAHGLDPAGITEIRNLIRRLGDEGRTIFLSSHLLSEVQQVCDHVAILRKGKVAASGTVKEILSMSKLQRMV
ncbi:MAG: ABC transporter ATP-binding protein, partial [Acidimicrobiia bacterium]